MVEVVESGSAEATKEGAVATKDGGDDGGDGGGEDVEGGAPGGRSGPSGTALLDALCISFWKAVASSAEAPFQG